MHLNEKSEAVRNAMLCMARQCWEQGLAAQAMLEIGDTDALVHMAHDCVVRQNADGRLCDVEGTPALVDPAICVEPVMEAARIVDEPEWQAAAMRNVEYLLRDAPRSDTGAYYHLAGGSEVWADCLGMGPHVLVKYGHIDEGIALFKAVKAYLFDEASGLYHHKWDVTRGAFSRACFWAIGNGWAMLGLLRMYKHLIQLGDARSQWAGRELVSLYSAVLPYQAQDGGFHDVLDDPNSFMETEFTEMFAYTVANMVLLKLLPDTALSDAQRAGEYARSKVDRFGWVQGCAGSPTFEQPGVSTEGQAHFLMMEAALAGLEE